MFELALGVLYKYTTLALLGLLMYVNGLDSIIYFVSKRMQC